ncbi:MAG: Stp1/IreP family PP2C-type Ser/Thr phosphatase [Anaerolineae bacterium]
MKCPKCGYENRPGAHFCQQCGATLNAGHPSGIQTDSQTVNPEQSAVNDPAATQPLPQIQSGYAPLPVGAVIGGRYVVQGLQKSADQSASYLVEDLEPARLCPQCNTVIDDADEQFCVTCGADISETPLVHLRYQLEETTDPQAFSAERQLLELRLHHPGLHLPLAIFSETPYGPERHYRLLSEFSTPTAISMPVPQELNDVLTWCSDLASALAHLHRHQVVLATPHLNHVVIADKEAAWVNLDQAYVISPKSRGRVPDLLNQDVQGLAGLCLYLATGQRQLSPDLDLPGSLQALLAQAFNGRLMAPEFSERLDAELQQLRRPESVMLVVGQKTDVGQVRTLNEDSLLTLQMTPVYRSRSQPVGVFAVADGMGGHDAGDVASHLTCAVIARQAVAEVMTPLAQEKPPPEPGAWLTDVVQTANRELYETRTAARSEMGTTLTLAFVQGDTAVIANVGDSRAYHLTPEGLTQITTDHSLVERLVETGQITRAEAANHPQKNVIYRVMGDRPKVEADLFDQRLQIGEALLLCSDGLSGMVPDDKIWHLWKTSYSPQQACDRLIEAANQAGGEDNITVIVVQATHS